MSSEFHDKLITRLTTYANVGTQSKENSDKSPSSDEQKILGLKLKDELISFGLDVNVDEYGYVYGKLKGSLNNVSSIGFVSHLDTAPGVPAFNIEPRVHKVKQGVDIILEDDVVISAKDIINYVGDTIITSNGKTLLGADDKAGVSVIMTAIEKISSSFKGDHGDIYVMFNPDEEIGEGTKNFNPKKFPVKFAYTLDGEGVGEIECETFYAAKAVISVKGRTAHPGQGGYQKLVNPVSIACEYENAIPSTERPESTKGRFGFYYPSNISGNPHQATLEISIRDFEKDGLTRRKTFLTKLAEVHNNTYGTGTVTLQITDQYPNMKSELDRNPDALNIAILAMKNSGVEKPSFPSIRGGTDGAMLTVKYGIPTPNISAGMHNIHSVKEFASVNEMTVAVNFILNTVKIISEKYN